MPRKSIYLPDDVMPMIGADEQGGFSSRLTGIIKERAAMIREAMPELTEPEWCLVMDMLNGVVLDDYRHTRFLGDDIRESAQLDGLGEKWGVDGESLGSKIDTMSLPARIAIHDVAYRFWQHESTDLKETLTKCGARIKS